MDNSTASQLPMLDIKKTAVAMRAALILAANFNVVRL